MVTALDKQTALVLIDLQHAIVDNPQLTMVEETLANVARLVEAFRTVNWPVAVVHVEPAGAPWTKTRKESKAAPPTQPNANEIVPQVKTRPDDIFITKRTWNAFFETDLDAELRRRGITGMVLAGISTSIGVEGTARNASALGYNIAFATDAMTDTVRDAHDRSIKYIFPRIGELDITANIIQKILETANAR